MRDDEDHSYGRLLQESASDGMAGVTLLAHSRGHATSSGDATSCGAEGDQCWLESAAGRPVQALRRPVLAQNRETATG